MPDLKESIVTHWRKFRPTIVHDLERSGEFDAVVTNLERTVLETRADAIRRGMSPQQAEDAVASMWMQVDEDGIG